MSQRFFNCFGFLKIGPGSEHMMSMTGPEANLNLMRERQQEREIERILSRLRSREPLPDPPISKKLKEFLDKFPD